MMLSMHHMMLLKKGSMWSRELLALASTTRVLAATSLTPPWPAPIKSMHRARQATVVMVVVAMGGVRVGKRGGQPILKHDELMLSS